MKPIKSQLILLTLALCFTVPREAAGQTNLQTSVISSGSGAIGDSSLSIVGVLGPTIIGEIPLTSGSDDRGLWYLQLQNFVAEVKSTLLNVPTEFRLEQNYPNPFNPETRIRFQLPEASEVTIRIFNMLGQTVRTLVAAPYEPGAYAAIWNGADDRGAPVASGVYLYRIQAGDFSQVKKMSLLR